MRKFHSIAALCGNGLRPELQALFDRLAVDPHTELFIRPDGMTQAGPDPVSESADVILGQQNERPNLVSLMAEFGQYRPAGLAGADLAGGLSNQPFKT
jgi:hypothetical protein